MIYELQHDVYSSSTNGTVPETSNAMQLVVKELSQQNKQLMNFLATFVNNAK